MNPLQQAVDDHGRLLAEWARGERVLAEATGEADRPRKRRLHRHRGVGLLGLVGVVTLAALIGDLTLIVWVLSVVTAIAVLAICVNR